MGQNTIQQAGRVIDRLAKYAAIGFLHYALYLLVIAGKLDVMYFYTTAGATLTGMGVHAAVTTNVGRQIGVPTSVIFGKKDIK